MDQFRCGVGSADTLVAEHRGPETTRWAVPHPSATTSRLLDVDKPEILLASVRSAGSVFLGSISSVVFGDYCSGTNHILPTKGTASMRSALSVYDFLKVIPYQKISEAGAAKLSKTVDILARAEGLPAHADAALARIKKEAKR